jgi:two-component system nitrate/nitrite response regulator NarP
MPNVLIVDDNAEECGILRCLFDAQSDFVVCGEAENGSEAVAKARELSPDLIVLHLSTLLLGALEAAQALKLAKPDVPLFMITVDYTAATEREALSRGISAVFAKDDELKNCLLPNARAVFQSAHEAGGD